MSTSKYKRKKQRVVLHGGTCSLVDWHVDRNLHGHGHRHVHGHASVGRHGHGHRHRHGHRAVVLQQHTVVADGNSSTAGHSDDSSRKAATAVRQQDHEDQTQTQLENNQRNIKKLRGIKMLPYYIEKKKN